jgi:hypothetical protein
MIERCLFLGGCFLIGVGLTGFVSYTTLIFPELRFWGVWMLILISGVLAVACLTDDYICQYLEMPYQQFIALLIGIILTLILGGFIQWQ